MTVPEPTPELNLPRPEFRAGRFQNPRRHQNRSWWEVLRWKLTTRPAPWPDRIPLTPGTVPPAPANGVNSTWVGHSTFLLRFAGLSVLTDPQWSEYAGPFGRLGPRRAHVPGLRLEDLPPLDAILLSHDHYDHCDLPTLRRLARAHPAARLFAPLGFARLAARAGFAPARVHLSDWWQTHELLPGYRITATPARHWGNRLSGARNARLWCGWRLATPGCGVHFVGDTAYDADMFPAIRRHLGAPDLALIPIGAYAPRWFMHEQHCAPSEAVNIHLALGARRSIGMHWGTFPLTDEPRDEPSQHLATAVAEARLPPDAFTTLDPGATLLA